MRPEEEEEASWLRGWLKQKKIWSTLFLLLVCCLLELFPVQSIGRQSDVTRTDRILIWRLLPEGDLRDRRRTEDRGPRSSHSLLLSTSFFSFLRWYSLYTAVAAVAALRRRCRRPAPLLYCTSCTDRSQLANHATGGEREREGGRVESRRRTDGARRWRRQE